MLKLVTKKYQKKSIRRLRKISIVISGMPSVGKTTAAEVIAKRFHLSHIAGGDMLREIAIEQGYHPTGPDWWDTTNGMKFLSERANDAKFDREVDRRLINYVRKGGVVITSYTIPWLCNEGLKIWFAASQKVRARRLAGRDKISIFDATKIVKRRDNRNRKLYFNMYKFEFGKDLNVFNYIIDTEEMTADQVTEAAVRLVMDYRMSLNSH